MKKLLLNNLGLKLASLALAFILWFLVVQIEDPQDSVTFSNVQVKLVNTEVLEKEGKVYEVVDTTDVARVTVYAPKSIIGQIRKTDIVAEADMNKLTDINTIAINYYVDNLQVDLVEGNQEVVRLSVEDKMSKWVRLIGNTVGDVAEGYIISSASPDQTNIEITGPESAVSMVEYAAVDINVAGASTSLSANIDIQLYDAEGNAVNNSSSVKNVNSAYMKVEILATKEVPIELDFVGEPAEDYMATGAVQSDVTSVLLAGKLSVLEGINSIVIPAERLDITGVTGNLVEVVNLKEFLPDNVKLADKTFNGKTTVTVYVEPIIEKELNIPVNNVAISNVPEGLAAELPEEMQSYALTISGLTRYISTVRQEQIFCYINMAEYMEAQNLEELVPGIYSIPATVNLSENITVETPINIDVIVSEIEEEDEE